MFQNAVDLAGMTLIKYNLGGNRPSQTLDIRNALKCIVITYLMFAL